MDETSIAEKASDHFGNEFRNVFAASEKENIPAAFALKAAGISYFHGFLFFFSCFFCSFLAFCPAHFFTEQFAAVAFLGGRCHAKA